MLNQIRWDKMVFNKGLLKKSMSGILSIGIGLSLLLIHPSDVWRKMMLIFTENGILFTIWQNPAAYYDTFVKFYLFNITNKEAFLDGKEKIKLQEVGPYFYIENLVQLNSTFDHHEGTVTTNPRYSISWADHLNKGREDDVFVLPNIAMLLASTKIVEEYPIFVPALNLLVSLTSSRPIIEQTLRQYAFDFESPLVKYAHKLFPSWITFEKLGLLDRMYDNENDFYATYTGEIDPKSGGLINKFNNHALLTNWNSSSCNLLRGSSNGVKLGKDVHPNQTIYIFRKMLCRTLPFVQVRPAVVSNTGIKEALYHIKQSALDNGSENPDNKCFCRKQRCLPSGLMDVSDCFFGLPVALSNPHFYNNDPMLLENVDGLEPQEKLHNSYLYLNQETGIPTRVSVKIQVNLVNGGIQDINQCDKFSHMILPIAWVEIEIPEIPLLLKLALFFLLQGLPFLETVATYLLLFIGSLLVAIALKTYLCKRKCRHLNYHKVLNATEMGEGFELVLWRNTKTQSTGAECQKKASLSFYKSSFITHIAESTTI